MGVWVQPTEGWQASLVQALPSSQLLGPGRHWPAAQWYTTQMPGSAHSLVSSLDHAVPLAAEMHSWHGLSALTSPSQ